VTNENRQIFRLEVSNRVATEEELAAMIEQENCEFHEENL